MQTLHIAAALGAAALAGGIACSAAVAQDAGQARTRQVIILRDRVAGPDGAPAPLHTFRLGPDGAAGCAAKGDEIDEQSGEGREHTRIILCGDDHLSAAERSARLQEALGKIENNQDLSAEQKAKVVAALRATIARLEVTR